MQQQHQSIDWKLLLSIFHFRLTC